jgi:transposase InsO family protein
MNGCGARGSKVPARQPKRGRLWLNEGSCVRLRPAHPNHVWAYDFVHERMHDGRALRLLTVVDEYTRECLAIRVGRRLCSEDVLQQLTALFVARGTPQYLRSDNGPELTATAVREWLARVGVTTLFIAPGSPWENGYIESFNGKLRDELLRPGDLLHRGGGDRAHGVVAAGIQPPPAPQRARLPTASSRGHRPAPAAGQLLNESPDGTGLGSRPLLRALILQLLYSIRSERLLMEQLAYNLLFRWFVGLNMDEPVWDASTFSKNRDPSQAERGRAPSDRHWSTRSRWPKRCVTSSLPSKPR